VLEPCDRQLHLHPALAADELVPLVHHQHIDLTEVLLGAGTREQQAQ
jgi:hypothetical protein